MNDLSLSSGTHRKTPSAGAGAGVPELAAVVEAEGPVRRRILGSPRPHPPSGGFQQRRTLLFGRESVLAEKLSTVSDDYDVCIIDCPPSLGMLTLNALVAGADVVVPVPVHCHAMEGLRQLLETVSIVRERFRPCSVKILGLLLTFVENKTKLSKQIQQQMKEFFGGLVFDTVVHRTARLAEAPSAGESIVTYAPTSKGAAEYAALAAEIFNGESPASQEEMAADEIRTDQARR